MMVVWSGGPLTPRKYKAIFFVRCKCFRSLPCPAGTKGFGGASNRSPSTCLKTPQNCFKEGRLKSFFANNVDIPFTRARRLKPCPRKATVRSGKQIPVYVAVYIFCVKRVFFLKYRQVIASICIIFWISAQNYTKKLLQ